MGVQYFIFYSIFGLLFWGFLDNKAGTKSTLEIGNSEALIFELSVKWSRRGNSVQTHGKTESHLFLGKNEFCLSFPTS